ncbi:unnamed protein product [Cylindrotheca closterium]|uniref:PNPLA domain-containing protein n=1 Tax=Cylindrotheca closterium TaxID=2856 RepID=A0AAD2G167_9STRA|nr:unnamed protein product [Cylindrotheca closterium]
MAPQNSNSVNFLLLVTILFSCTIQSWSFRVSNGQQGLVQNYQVLDTEGDDVLRGEESQNSQYGAFGILPPKSNNNKTKKLKPDTIIVDDIESLRQAVLDEQTDLKKVRIENYVKEQTEAISDHEVLRLIKERFETYSTPGNRKDNATLAIAMEGGGMRGCVSAGMAAAIASLGLSDVFDTVYGSSAGSAVGAYLISRQICLDVYLDILPAAKTQFVCKKRLFRSMVSNLAQVMVSGLKRSKTTDQTSTVESSDRITPGLNISYLLDGILGHNHGLRPLDMEKLEENEKKQRLRIVSSAVDADGNMFSKVFGSEDFFNSTMMQKQKNGNRQGLFACMQASMSVPGATGPPVRLHSAMNEDDVHSCFDAFCFEPIPFRSAVEEGATHVLTLCTRPEGFKIKTKPGMYEKGIASVYFKSQGMSNVAEYFKKGGQQFIYAEDLLTLEEGKISKSSPVLVPPPKIFHGIMQTEQHRREIECRDKEWKKAFLLPLKVPEDTPELSTVEQDRESVLAAVRSGYAAAFDLLAPVVGVDLGLTGDEVSQLIFPTTPSHVHYDTSSSTPVKDPEMEDERVLNTQLRVPGAPIRNFEVSTLAFDGWEKKPRARRERGLRRAHLLKVVRTLGGDSFRHPAAFPRPTSTGESPSSSLANESAELAHVLLHSLPGLNGERAFLHHLSKGLRNAAYGREPLQ